MDKKYSVSVFIKENARIGKLLCYKRSKTLAVIEK